MEKLFLSTDGHQAFHRAGHAGLRDIFVSAKSGNHDMCPVAVRSPGRSSPAGTPVAPAHAVTPELAWAACRDAMSQWNPGYG